MAHLISTRALSLSILKVRMHLFMAKMELLALFNLQSPVIVYPTADVVYREIIKHLKQGLGKTFLAKNMRVENVDSVLREHGFEYR